MDAVLNWVWQGTLVALLTAVMLKAAGPGRAPVRCAVVWIALVSVLLLPLVPRLELWASSPGLASAGDSIPHSPLLVLPHAWWTSDLIVFALQALWSVVFAARAAASLIALRRATRGCRHFPADREAGLRHWVFVRFRGRRTRLVLSDEVRAAAVFAGRTPIIAVAPALFRRLDIHEIDRVVIHEWAHIQRRDDIAHLAQLVIRGVAGWHPAVWWLDRQLHRECEAACDEIAVRLTGSARAYACCLAKLAGQAGPIRSLPAVAASSSLRWRIARILSPPASAASGWARSALIGAGVLPLVLALTVGGIRMIDEATIIATVTLSGPAAEGLPITAVPMPAGISTSAQRRNEKFPARLPAASTAVRRRLSASVDSRAARTPLGANVASSMSAGSRTLPASAPLETAREMQRGGESISSTSTPPAPLDAVARVSDSASGLVGAVAERPAVSALDRSAEETKTPWDAAADGGVAVSRGSQRAAAAVGGFFTRLSKKVARSF